MNIFTLLLPLHYFFKFQSVEAYHDIEATFGIFSMSADRILATVFNPRLVWQVGRGGTRRGE